MTILKNDSRKNFVLKINFHEYSILFQNIKQYHFKNMND